MEPQLLRCGNCRLCPIKLVYRWPFNGATTFALWKHVPFDAGSLPRGTPSMEPQLLRCGNIIHQSNVKGRVTHLQWSHNFCVVETSLARLLCWGRLIILQWSHNFCVVETIDNKTQYICNLSPSMEPQLLRCGNPLFGNAVALKGGPSMEPQLLRCGNRRFRHEHTSHRLPSMEPQLLRCGNLPITS